MTCRCSAFLHSIGATVSDPDGAGVSTVGYQGETWHTGCSGSHVCFMTNRARVTQAEEAKALKDLAAKSLPVVP